MSACDGACPLEMVQQDPVSVGPIQDEELILRGAFSPSAGDGKKLKVRASLVPKKVALEGKVSVYRLGAANLDIPQCVTLLEQSRPGVHLFGVLGATAGALRNIRIGDGRAFCVLDECDTDEVGGKHPAHAHISLCRKLISEGVDIEDPLFIDAHRALVAAFSPNWQYSNLRAA